MYYTSLDRYDGDEALSEQTGQKQKTETNVNQKEIRNY